MRRHVIDTKKPKYVTVLDLSQLVENDTPVEELRRVRYSGPMYFDWDCDDLMDGAQSVRDMLKLLEEEFEVDTACVRLYATGGRGYHAEIPFGVFCATPQLVNAGVPLLPLIYKELWYELYTQDADGAIYSTKRGRMWRTPNVERETAGRYKVPITRDELNAMTPELYVELTSQPQPFPVYPEPVLSPRLAAKFDDFRKKVDEKMRVNAKRKDNSAEAVKAFEGEWPPSALRAMNGEGLNPDVGLNRIALQLGILSVALGKSLDEHIAACKGLIASHKGDGHSNKRQVRNELKRMYAYADNNPTYTYSSTAFRSILAEEGSNEDLAPEASVSSKRERGDLGDLSGGISIGNNGTYLRKDGISRRETNWHYRMESAVEVVDAESENLLGYEFDSMDSGTFIKRDFLDSGAFASSDRMKSFLANRGAVSPKLDSAKIGGIHAQMLQSSRRNGTVHAVSKEGLSLLPGESTSEPGTLIWASADGCQMYKEDDKRYKFKPLAGSEEGNFRSDLMQAPELASLDRDRVLAVLDAMLHFTGNDYTVAATLGWMLSCFLKPYHIKLNKSFPLLEVYGESGGGKTTTVLSLLQMFYYRNAPRATTCGSGSPFGRRLMMSSSESIPYFFDEFKPREMNLDQVKEMRMLFHEAYTPAMQAARGGGIPGRNSAWHEMSQDMKTTPVIFSTENPETQTALQERVLAVPFAKSFRRAHERAIQILQHNPDVVSAFGRITALAAMAYGGERMKLLISESHEKAYALARDGNSRVVYNYGVAISGLEFFGRMLSKALGTETYHGERIRGRLSHLIEILRNPDQLPVHRSAPEIFKILHMMVTVSRQDSHDSDIVCKPGIEFGYHRNGDLDIDADTFYGRYRVAASRRGAVPTFSDVDQFWIALSSSSVVKQVRPPDSPLLTEANQMAALRIARFDAEVLQENGIGMFARPA